MKGTMNHEPIPDTERPDLLAQQPAPKPNDLRPVWELVVEDMKARDDIGRERYGTPLQAFNGRDPLVDAYQEALDLVVYLRQAIYERISAVDLKPTPHREAMAAEIRRLQAREQELLESNARLIDARRDVDRQAMVRQFMRVFGQPISATPGTVPAELTPTLHGFVGEQLVRFRVRLVAEEFLEFLYATLDSPTMFVDRRKYSHALVEEAVMGFVDNAPIVVDLPEAIDATLDMDYVNQGFRDTFGVDSTPLWLEVHKSNMAKAGPDGVPRRRPEDGKVLKPDGWTPPDIRGVLTAQGWRPSAQDGD